MTLDEIRAALRHTEGVPRAALAEAVAHAADLAPEVLELLAAAGRGVHLLPDEEDLLFYGLLALAAARHTAACAPFLALLRRPGRELERLFGDVLGDKGTPMLLALYDGDDDALYALIEDASVDGMVRWKLFETMARLVWEGRTPRERFVALIDRFDREALAPAGNPAWEGWQDAVYLLGLAEFEPRVRAGWAGDRHAFHREVDAKDWLERLAAAVAAPDDPARFVERDIVPLDDPVAAIAWLDRGATSGAPAADDDDPARTVALGAHELEWLAGFLAGDKVSPATMNLEAVDGFFSALAAGPVMVPPSEFMDQIWGGEAGQPPAFDHPRQAEYVHALLLRHWNSIVARLGANVAHAPVIDSAGEVAGIAWAEGFLRGVMLRQDAWRPLSADRTFSSLMRDVLGLLDGVLDDAKPLTPRARQATLDALPKTLLGISMYWRLSPAQRRAAAATPARGVKVGRNEPCPCGSGRKFKKCCLGRADLAFG